MHASAIGVPGHDLIDALASDVAAKGVAHDGVHRTPVGWVLLGVRDPDGHVPTRSSTPATARAVSLGEWAVGRALDQVGEPDRSLGG